jgi:predicted phosphodiesterase
MGRTAVFALLAVAWLGACFSAAPASAQEPVFHMAILSDRTGSHVPGIYPRVIEQINLLNPDIVVTVGDQIEGYGEDYERSEAEWDSVLVLLEAIEAPLYLIAGNHDIWDDTSEVMYTEKTGFQPYYSFDHGNTHFVVLDVSRIESSADLPEEQKAWLVEDLESNRDAENIFVFYHKPLWEQTLPHGESDPMHDIFVTYGVDAVFNGHYHEYFAGDYDGVEYTTIGSSGAYVDQAAPQPDLRGTNFQFGWVTVTSPGYELAVVELDGVKPRDTITMALREEIQRVESDLVSVGRVRAEEGAASEEPVTVTIENVSSGTLDDVITWDAPEGWHVEPADAAVTIPPGATHELEFRLRRTGPLYPVPSMSTSYPLSNGRRLDVRSAVGVMRTASAAVLPSRPRIDGKPTERCWGAARPIAELYAGYGYSEVDGRTEFSFGHDDENLYVSAVCHDDVMDELAAEVTERDGSVYAEDCVGFFFQPDPEEMVVYQIYVNPSGVVFDQRISFDETMYYTAEREWDGKYEIATFQGDDHWSIEIGIPLAQFGVGAADGQRWGLNFRRKQARAAASADWQVPIEYDPRTFGELAFE